MQTLTMPNTTLQPTRTPAEEDDFARKLLRDHIEQQHTQQLTPAEILAVRDMLEGRRRWQWIGASVKTWAVTITAVVAAWTVGIDVLKSFVKSLGR